MRTRPSLAAALTLTLVGSRAFAAEPAPGGTEPPPAPAPAASPSTSAADAAKASPAPTAPEARSGAATDPTPDAAPDAATDAAAATKTPAPIVERAPAPTGAPLQSSVTAATPMPAPADAPESSALAAPSERRDGVVLGTSVGFALGQGSGYPNSSQKIDVDRYYGRTGAITGVPVDVFAMMAITDYLNFGGFFHYAELDGGRWSSSGYGVGVRADAFPLLRVSPRLADLGVFARLGIGGTKIRAQGDYEALDGTQSFLGAGAFYEIAVLRALGGHLTAAPTAQVDWITSISADRAAASLGLRLAVYTAR